MDSLLTRNIEALTESDIIMDAWRLRVVVCQSLITLMTGHVKRLTHKIGEDHHLTQRLQQPILETIYQSLLEMPKMEAGAVTPPTHAPSETDSD